jgi:hypothetical protein
MALPQSFLAHWHLQLPSLALAALVYLLAARLAASLLLARETVLNKALAALTDPVLVPVAAITPRAVPAPLVIVLAIAWMLAARLAVFLAAAASGVRLAAG